MGKWNGEAVVERTQRSRSRERMEKGGSVEERTERCGVV